MVAVREYSESFKDRIYDFSPGQCVFTPGAYIKYDVNCFIPEKLRILDHILGSLKIRAHLRLIPCFKSNAIGEIDLKKKNTVNSRLDGNIGEGDPSQIGQGFLPALLPVDDCRSPMRSV